MGVTRLVHDAGGPRSGLLPLALTLAALCGCDRGASPHPDPLVGPSRIDAGGQGGSGGAPSTGGTGGGSTEMDAGRTDAAHAPDATPVDPNAACAPCEPAYICCGNECVDPTTDPLNCGGCGNACPSERNVCWPTTWPDGVCSSGCPFEDAGYCGCDEETDVPCYPDCCNSGEICCAYAGTVGNQSFCHRADAGTCPKMTWPPGPFPRVCASVGTLVSTPDGERAIQDLVAGELVFSVDDGAIVAVPLVRVSRTTAPEGHRMVRVTLASGAVVEMSPGHPLADGRTFADLARGALLGEAEVASVEEVPYDGDFTYDILPASSTGAYFASGALVGSTLAR